MNCIKKIGLFILVLVCAQAFAQVERSSDLFRALKTQDSLLFDGFNTCNYDRFEQMLSDNFAFYHDEAGRMDTKNIFIATIRRVCGLKYKAIRELTESSLEVFPLHSNGKLYGAIQNGRHRFYALEDGKPKQLTSAARFTHLWLLEEGKWKFAQGYSFDHQKDDTGKTK